MPSVLRNRPTGGFGRGGSAFFGGSAGLFIGLAIDLLCACSECLNMISVGSERVKADPGGDGGATQG